MLKQSGHGVIARNTNRCVVADYILSIDLSAIYQQLNELNRRLMDRAREVQ